MKTRIGVVVVLMVTAAWVARANVAVKVGADLKAKARALTGQPDKPAPKAEAKDDGWTSLFNGKDLTGWTCRKNGWHVADGVITWRRRSGFLWSAEQYGNFVLDLEFKLAKKTNSGVFVRTASKRNWLHTGIEVQILDSHGKEKVGRGDCGAVYDCLAPSKNMVRKPGEWNRMVVTCRDNVIRVTLNGEQVIDMDLDRWTEAHKNPDGSKNKFRTAYKDMPRRGYLAIQDHGNPIWLRNIRIKPLDKAKK
jgi:hypothetical protein